MHHEIIEFIHPDLFKEYEEVGYSKGFDFVESGPLESVLHTTQKDIFKLLYSKHDITEIRKICSCSDRNINAVGNLYK